MKGTAVNLDLAIAALSASWEAWCEEFQATQDERNHLMAALVWTMQHAKLCANGADTPGGFSMWAVPAEHAAIMGRAHDLAFPEEKSV